MDNTNKKPLLEANGFSIKKIAKGKTDVKKMLFYIDNLNKLLEQHSDWFFIRFEYVQEGRWNKANEIEMRYLTPLHKKILSLAKTALEDLQ